MARTYNVHMKRFVAGFGLSLAFCLLAGCGTGGTSTSAKSGNLPSTVKDGSATAAEGNASKDMEVREQRGPGPKPNADAAQGIAGQWYGEFDKASIAKLKASPESRQMASLAASMKPSLELTASGRFKMDIFGASLEGAYVQKGVDLTLNAETIMGMKLSDPSVKSNPMFASVAEPMKGKVEKGGTSLYFPGDKSDPNDIDLRFTREGPAEEKVGARSVKAAEAKLVGSYAFDESYQPSTAGLTKAQLRAQKFSLNMMRGFKLSLREDNTFSITMMLNFRGTWKLSGDTLKMIATEPKEMIAQMPATEKPEFTARVKDNGKRLIFINDKNGQEDGALVRTK